MNGEGHRILGILKLHRICAVYALSVCYLCIPVIKLIRRTLKRRKRLADDVILHHHGRKYLGHGKRSLCLVYKGKIDQGRGIRIRILRYLQPGAFKRELIVTEIYGSR